MRRTLCVSLVVSIGLGTTGCGSGPSKRSLGSNEPGLSSVPGDSGAAVVESPRSASSVAFVDRHPLLSKPRQYYQNTNSNKAVKTAAATVVGVPAGIYGELKQIVVGAPQPITPTSAP